jgi:ATP-binding cassette, subfamily B, bacterial MsbA
MDLYLRLLKFVKPYWIKLAMAMACMSLVGGAQPLTAYLVKPVLDQVFYEKKGEMLLLISAGIVVIYLFKGLFDYLQAYFMGFVGQKAITDIRDVVFRKIQEQPLSYFDKTPTGLIISRIINDISLVQSTVSDGFTAVLKDVFSIVGLIFVVFYRDWWLASISFIVLPFASYAIMAFGRKLRQISVQNQKAMARLTSFLHEVITGQRIVKAFSMEEYENERFGMENHMLLRLALKRYRVRALSSPLMEVLGGVAIGIIIWYGGGKVIHGTSTPGNFFSFMAALLMLYEPIKRVNKENHNIQQGLAAAQRVFEVIDRKPEIYNRGDATVLPSAQGSIEFSHVFFKYEEKMVLNDLNLRIEKNEVVAIVGESGVGKSTLVNLIPRFYDVTSGSLEIDQTDIRTVTLDSLRRNIALVTQDVILFNDTIMKNIAYGAVEDADRIEKAARLANAHDFIMKLPKEYETTVGEKGVRLSGGQKQRIAIARAFYKNAPILILDEATSALDTASETEVQRALENLMKGRTTIIIAHRLSTIINADRIIVLEKGTIIQEGTHTQLMEQEGPYKRLYTLQFKEGRNKKVIRLNKRQTNEYP